jgi:hypothetical protein
MATSAPVNCQFYPNEQSSELATYQVSPINLFDVERINLHVQAKLIRAARASLDLGVTEQAKRDILDAAMRVASELNLLSNSQAFKGIEVASYILHTSLVKYQPDITTQQCYEIVKDDRNIDEYIAAMAVIRGDKEAAKTDTTENPTQPQQ